MHFGLDLGEDIVVLKRFWLNRRHRVLGRGRCHIIIGVRGEIETHLLSSSSVDSRATMVAVALQVTLYCPYSSEESMKSNAHRLAFVPVHFGFLIQ